MKRLIATLVCAAVLSAGLRLGQAAPAGEPEPAPVVLVIDESGSMKGPPLDQAAVAAALFIAGSDGGIAPGIVVFNSRIRVLTDRLEPAVPRRRKELLAALEQLSADGQTDVLGAVWAALEMLRSAKAGSKWIVLLTDGRQTQPVPQALDAGRDVVKAGQALAEKARLAGVRILAVGLGPQADRPLLEALAVGTNGVYLPVQEPAKLLETYVSWLRQVGGYYTADNVQQVPVAGDDRDLKVLTAMPSGNLKGLTRDGQSVDLDGKLWKDDRMGLAVVQLPDPAQGAYRPVLATPLRAEDRLYFLSRRRQQWDAKIDYSASDPLAPMRVVLRGVAGTPTDPWTATAILEDLSGKCPPSQQPLKAQPDGSLTADMYVDGRTQAQVPGVYNLKVRTQGGGWSSERCQTVRIEPSAPRVQVRVEGADADGATDLGPRQPGSEVSVAVQVRSAVPAPGRSLVLAPASEGEAIVLEAPREVALKDGTQTFQMKLRMPSTLTGAARGGVRVTFANAQGDELINGSRGPLVLQLSARASGADLAVAVTHPAEAMRVEVGDKGVIHWVLRANAGAVPGAILAAELAWGSPREDATVLGLGEQGGSNPALTVPLTPETRIPVSIQVPLTARPGCYKATLTIKAVGDRPLTINGKPELTLPVVFEIARRAVRLRLLDADGHELKGNTCRHTVLSPVEDRLLRLRFLILGDVSSGLCWRVKNTAITLQGVRCEVAVPTTEPSLASNAPHFNVLVDVPRQASPGVRRFDFEFDDPGPGIALAEDSKHFAVEVDVPPARLILDVPAGGLVLDCRLGYREWANLVAFGRPTSWRRDVRVQARTTGLDDGVACRLVDVSPAEANTEFAIAPAAAAGRDSRGQSWAAPLRMDVLATGRHPIRARLSCPYSYLLAADAAGTALPADRESGTFVLGAIDVRPPSAVPPALFAAAVLGLIVLDRAWRRRVPGRLLAAEGAEGGVRLGRRRQRLVIDGRRLAMKRRWRTVWVRWVGGDKQGPVQVRSPQGEIRPLELKGDWEPVYQGDSLGAGSKEFVYSAPVGRRHEPVADEFGLGIGGGQYEFASHGQGAADIPDRN